MLLHLVCWGMVVTMMRKDVATVDLLGYGNNNNERISRALIHVKHAQLR